MVGAFEGPHAMMPEMVAARNSGKLHPHPPPPPTHTPCMMRFTCTHFSSDVSLSERRAGLSREKRAHKTAHYQAERGDSYVSGLVVRGRRDYRSCGCVARALHRYVQYTRTAIMKRFLPPPVINYSSNSI
jgi:hypothetical protein